MNQEIRELSSYPGYGCDSEGNVYSRRQRGTGALTDSWKPVKGVPGQGGYLGVSPWVGGKGHYRRVHNLVAEAWLGPKPGDDYEVHHMNGDKLNNSPENLCYVTRQHHSLIHRASRRKKGPA